MSDSEELAEKLWKLRHQTKKALGKDIYERTVHPFREKLQETAEPEPEDQGHWAPAYIRAYIPALYVAKMTRDHAAEVMYGCALCDLLEWSTAAESDTKGDPG